LNGDTQQLGFLSLPPALVAVAAAGTYRSLWETYYKGVDAVIFVVDSTDKIRMCVAKDELDAMLAHPDVKKASSCPILFFANKMDLPRAMEPSDIMAMLQLQRIGDQAWHIQASNALTGEGVDAGVDWLAAQLSKPPSTASGKPAAAAGAGAGAAVPGAATSPAAGATGGAGAAPAR
jgi:50S ribosomal subunit-associated GTPase HflX